MVNQHETNQNYSQSENKKGFQNSHSQQITHRKERTLFTSFCLLLLFIVGGATIGLELSGVTNVIHSFGRGGRPTITFGLWRFTDVPDSFWAEPFINALLEKKVINGYPNDTFRPEQAITRAEFAAMLNVAIDQEISQTTLDFDDVPDEFWGAPAILNTAEAGFFKGYTQDTFQPEKSLSRVHAFIALTEGLEITTVKPPEEINQVLVHYKDASQIPEDAREAIAAAISARLIVHQPFTNRLNLDQPMTRAEAAAAIYQVLVYLGEAEPISSPYIVG